MSHWRGGGGDRCRRGGTDCDSQWMPLGPFKYLPGVAERPGSLSEGPVAARCHVHRGRPRGLSHTTTATPPTTGQHTVSPRAKPTAENTPLMTPPPSPCPLTPHPWPSPRHRHGCPLQGPACSAVPQVQWSSPPPAAGMWGPDIGNGHPEHYNGTHANRRNLTDGGHRQPPVRHRSEKVHQRKEGVRKAGGGGVALLKENAHDYPPTVVSYPSPQPQSLTPQPAAVHSPWPHSVHSRAAVAEASHAASLP